MKTVEVYFFLLRFPWVKENSLGFSSDMPSTCTRSLIQNFYFLCSIITIMAWPSSLLGTMWSSDDGLDLVHLKGHCSHLRLYVPPWLLRVQSLLNIQQSPPSHQLLQHHRHHQSQRHRSRHTHHHLLIRFTSGFCGWWKRRCTER